MTTSTRSRRCCRSEATTSAAHRCRHGGGSPRPPASAVTVVGSGRRTGGRRVTGVGLTRLGETNVRPAGDPTPYPGHPGRIVTRDDPNTTRIEFAQGERLGLPWTMWLYREAHRMDDPTPRERWCDALKWDGVSSACPAAIPKNQFLSMSRSGGEASEDAVTGDLHQGVARVEVRLEGYAPFDVPVIGGPEIMPWREDPLVNYFVAFVPRGSSGTVAVFDQKDRS